MLAILGLSEPRIDCIDVLYNTLQSDQVEAIVVDNQEVEIFNIANWNHFFARVRQRVLIVHVQQIFTAEPGFSDVGCGSLRTHFQYAGEALRDQLIIVFVDVTVYEEGKRRSLPLLGFKRYAVLRTYARNEALADYETKAHPVAVGALVVVLGAVELKQALL